MAGWVVVGPFLVMVVMMVVLLGEKGLWDWVCGLYDGIWVGGYNMVWCGEAGEVILKS